MSNPFKHAELARELEKRQRERMNKLAILQGAGRSAPTAASAVETGRALSVKQASKPERAPRRRRT